MLHCLQRLFSGDSGEIYPSSHEVALERVLSTVRHWHENREIDDEELAEFLQAQGIPKVDAKLLVLYVPMAFAWAICRKMGVSQFPNYLVLADRDGNPVEMPVSREHYFLAALQVGLDVTENGFTEEITREGFEAILIKSADFDALNNALMDGKSIQGSRLDPPIILGVTSEEVTESRAERLS